METNIKCCPPCSWLDVVSCLEHRSSQEKALIPRSGFLVVKEFAINMPYSDSENKEVSYG